MIDFIGVGAEKTGSTWFFRALSEHPEICGAEGKELAFFDTTPLIDKGIRPQSNYEKFGIEKYQNYFNHCAIDSVKGEFTTTYLHDKNTARIIHKHFPAVKIFILLRNPVEKAFAQYIGLEGGRMFRNFEEALDKEPEFTRRSLYTEYVAEYFKYFPKEQIFIGLYDDMIKDPLLFIQKAYAFLGVSAAFTPSLIGKKIDSEEHKILTGFRNSLLKNHFLKFLISTSRYVGLNRLLKHITLFFIRKPAIRPETRISLKKTFLADIESLEKIIDRDLSLWK